MDRDSIDGAALRRGHAFYSRVDVVESTGSTNADLLAFAATREPTDAGAVVLVAEQQTGGRGRHQRTWESPPRAQLALSILLPTADISPPTLGWLPLLTGVVVVDMLAAAARVRAVLKWPNDILVAANPGASVRPGKVAGILAEVATPDNGGQSRGVVVGIGLNVAMTTTELPVSTATSLALAGAATLDRTALARALLEEFAARWDRWRETGWETAGIAEAYRARCATIGMVVRAELPGGTVLTGTAVGVDNAGRLLIRTDDGVETTVSAGDVTHLRAGASRSDR